MGAFLDKMHGLSAAEDFFRLLEVPYDQSVLNVSRLHILKRFQEYMRQKDVSSLSEEAVHDACRACLRQAYDDFLSSNGVKEKVFKVFKELDAPSSTFLPLSALKRDT